MDHNRYNQINTLIFKKLLSEKKIVLKEEDISKAIFAGEELGFDRGIMRRFVMECVLSEANCEFGGDPVFALADATCAVDTFARLRIEEELVLEHFSTQRVRFNKHMVRDFTKLCSGIGIGDKDAVEFLRTIMRTLSERAFS